MSFVGGKSPSGLIFVYVLFMFMFMPISMAMPMLNRIKSVGKGVNVRKVMKSMCRSCAFVWDDGHGDVTCSLSRYEN